MDAKNTTQAADLVIVGAGAAGLMAAIWAGRTNPHRSIILLDGAKKPGLKILISGGGRCNVTAEYADESAFAGSSRNAIKKVLRSFDVAQTIDFFRKLGVELKREETGKLFPVTDSAQTVWQALLDAANAVNVRIKFPRRVSDIQKTESGFCVSGDWGTIETPTVIIATGGKSLPKTGSDGFGYQLVTALGHGLTERIFPALVPLTLPKDHFICGLSGLTVPATLEVHSPTGKKLASFTDSTLCTHFGLSGPSVLDISRYFLDARMDNPDVRLVINWLPEHTLEQLDRELQNPGKGTVLGFLRHHLPERLAKALCEFSAVDPALAGHQLTRDQRRMLARNLTQLSLSNVGHRGFDFAEVTAGGVPLSELHLHTMESRLCKGLYLCGEICDVDGRIGGFNFQWAWASGYLAGTSAGKTSG
ncbi:MAG TPA: NAD(P)/FAD-dependent oxidoreductase [Acidobacteriota bacterium]|nr:NAD(P)/FAD-dependent oxidoreductase [Acidobacteriota bacterium]HNJ40063.1 NAD(P)/FAD-dependent oxidoreductase [Acidobacteriota bacterium]